MTHTKKYAKTTAFVLLCIFFLTYAIYHIGNAFREKISLFTVTKESLEYTEDLSGYIFRDETVLYGTGISCSYKYEDGEKIAKNSTVAKSYRTENANLRKSIEILESKIDILKKSATSLYIDLEQTDKKISELRTDIALKISSGNVSSVERLQNDLLVLLHQRSLAEQNKKNYDAEITALQAELAVLLSSESAISIDVISPSSGYFYSYTDGLESLFTGSAAQNISFESYDDIISATPSKSSAAVGNVASIGKWYFVCKTEISKAEEIVTDKMYECVFTDNSCEERIPLLAEIKIVDPKSSEVILVFSSTSMKSNFDFSREQRATFYIAKAEGLRVPSSAIRVEEGQTIVYIIKEGVCRPRKINIIFEKSGYCIVSLPENNTFLAMYDRIITDQNGLYDGMVINY